MFEKIEGGFYYKNGFVFFLRSRKIHYISFPNEKILLGY